MSRENVELGRQTVDAFNRRDLDALLKLMDEDVEGAPPLASLDGVYHGHDGIRRWWKNLFEHLSDFTIEIVEVRDAGDVTIAVLRGVAHVPGSDTPVEERLWIVAEWRDRKVVWWRTFQRETEALEAVGLRE